MRYLSFGLVIVFGAAYRFHCIYTPKWKKGLSEARRHNARYVCNANPDRVNIILTACLTFSAVGRDLSTEGDDSMHNAQFPVDIQRL
jgi:hypothetical protein